MPGFGKFREMGARNMRDIKAVVDGFAAPETPGPRRINGRFMRLERLGPHHGAGLFAAFEGDDAIWDWMAWGPFETRAQFQGWIEEIAAGSDPYFYAVVEQASGVPVGLVSFLRIAPAQGSIELGAITMARTAQRTPLASEAFIEMIRWAFAAGYRRFEWKCDTGNIPSRRAAMRLGLSYEGCFRQHMIVKGRNRDTCWFAAIDGEWPALCAAYDAWLAPENFDDTGAQRRSLSELTAPLLAAVDPGL